MTDKADLPIGIIDSGVGGLTVMKELLDRMPDEPFTYIGDDARCPYGSRPPEEVITFTTEMLEALDSFGVKLAVIACNTATAFALEHVRPLFDFPVIGVIEPGARTAIAKSEMKQIVVLGTSGTVKSGAYSRAIADLAAEADVTALACPTFVPIVERGVYKTPEADETVRQALLPLAGASFDAVILGCTHFPLLAPFISKHLPPGTELITSGSATADTVTGLLASKGALRPAGLTPDIRFYTTGDPQHFRHITEDWLELPFAHVEQLNLPYTAE
ncbi:glutamate racemase [Sporosarcina sp. NCCP-2716]|uniref:glutamate racemase n=1 Tax=Sporosarcina sp. NCCP-2716 TaxID=2943679 RepID=UPI00203B7101|nr:glutamate racemase [Sporosarcina sp. NCCP-2716]GKV68913.1 glutamate racemase [Sporosarcina sp. NCCP-2716]